MSAARLSRRERVEVLAWSLDDLLPAAKTAAYGGVAGEGPSRKRVCPACDGARVVVVKTRGVTTGSEACATCAGSGRVAVDAYTGRQVGTLEVSVQPRVERVGCSWCQEAPRSSWQATEAHPGGSWVPRSERFDGLPRGCGVRASSVCVACDGTGWRELTVVDDVTDAARQVGGSRQDAMLDRRAELGSYRELDAALGWVRPRAPVAHRVWVAEFVVCRPMRHRHREVMLRAVWDAVESLMPAEVRVPRDVVRAWRAKGERGVSAEARVRRLVADGRSVAEAGRVVGVSAKVAARMAYGRR